MFMTISKRSVLWMIRTMSRICHTMYKQIDDNQFVKICCTSADFDFCPVFGSFNNHYVDETEGKTVQENTELDYTPEDESKVMRKEQHQHTDAEPFMDFLANEYLRHQ